MHKDFACHYSPALKAAFGSTFIEAQTSTYRLTNTNDDTVHMLVYWIYTQKLYPEEEMPANAKHETSQGFQVVNLTKLWILADQLLIPRLQNQVARTLEAGFARTRIVSLTSLRLAYAQTARYSLISRLL